MGIPDHLTCLLRNPYAGQEATVRKLHEQLTGSKLGKEYIQVVYYHPAYLTYMQSQSVKVLVVQLYLTLCDLMEFSRQEYWSGLPFPFPGYLPDPGIEPVSAALQAVSFPSELPWKPHMQSTSCEMLGWMTPKLQSGLLGEMSTTSDIKMILL